MVSAPKRSWHERKKQQNLERAVSVPTPVFPREASTVTSSSKTGGGTRGVERALPGQGRAARQAAGLHLEGRQCGQGAAEG